MASETSTTTRGGITTMYRCDPYFSIQKIKLPDCMYVLPSPTYPLNVRWPDSKMRVSNSLTKLERQEAELREEIGNMMDKLKDLGEKYGVSTSYLDPLRARPVDVVVSVPATESVIPLVALYRMISSNVSCSYRVVVHSSAASVASDAQKKIFSDEKYDPDPQFKLTVIWKGVSDCAVPKMMVSVGSQVPVMGMANIMRFIVRLFAPELYEGFSPLIAAQVDTWLDLVTYQIVNGNVRSRGNVLRQLNSRLGSSKWLAGETFTLADLYTFVVLCGLNDPGKVPGNVQRWTKSCCEIPALTSLPMCPMKQLL